MKVFKSLFTVMLVAGMAAAGVVNVPGDQPTIQAGISAAQTGDTVLVADGTYTGSGNTNIDFTGKEITVMSQNGPESCIIDCNSSIRGVYYHSGEDSNSVFSGFTVLNGAQGSIFLMNVDNPVIDNCIIDGANTAGIYCIASDPIVTRCIVKNCVSGGNGGGFALSSSNPRIIQCTVYNNQAGFGGAIHCNSSNPYVSSCVFKDNFARGC